MKIDNINKSIGKISKSVSSKKKGEVLSAFSDHLAVSGNSGASTTSDIEDINRVDALFFLQEVDSESSANDQAILQGFDILGYLEEIRLGLLNGKISRELLERIDVMVSQWRKDVSSPELLKIIDEIDLRAKVELAKLSDCN